MSVHGPRAPTLQPQPSARCTPASIALPVLNGRAAPSASNAWQSGHTKIKHSRNGRRRALVLLLVHLGIAAHILLWLRYGRTVSPVEPSESMQTLREGVINAGFVFFASALISTAIFGRFFCGWGCHIVALQDACAWIMMRLGVKPKPFRARLLMLFPLALALYMFVWPVFHRAVLRPALVDSRGRMPGDLGFWLGQSDPLPGITTEFFVRDFWATFAPWYIAIPFILICTFGVVYFLGAKGFCTYGCPYGGFFAPIDRFAPGRIRVTDACEGCGHCTAVCTSNVRVHEEVRDFGMVVDPGCMKCMDCVSVCPKDALYFGFGAPAAFGKGRAARHAKAEAKAKKQSEAKALRAARWDLKWYEEIGLAIAFLILFTCYRAMFNQVAMLMAVGMGLIAAFCFWKLWSMRPVRLGGTPNIRLQAMQLRYRGRWKPAGYVLAAATIAMLALAAWGGYIRATLYGAERQYARLDTPLGMALRGDFQATPNDQTAARRAIELYHRADSPRNGGLGWSLTPDERLNVAYMHVLLGRIDTAAEIMERVIDTGNPKDSLISQAQELIVAAARRGAGIRGLTPEQGKLVEARVIALHERALARHPRLDNSRSVLSFVKLREGATFPASSTAPDQRPIYTRDAVTGARAIWESPTLASEKLPHASTFIAWARLELEVGGPANETAARVRPILERAQAALDQHDADARLAIANLYATLGDNPRAADLARDAAKVGRRTGAPEIAAAGLLRAVAPSGDAGESTALLASGVARTRKLGPSSGRVSTLVSAAAALVGLGRTAEALALFKEAADIVLRAPSAPGNGRIWDLHGIASALTAAAGNTQNPAFMIEAVALLEKARDSAPAISLIRADLARTYMQLSRLDDAERELGIAAATADRNPGLAREYSSFLANRGKPQEAIMWERTAQKRSEAELPALPPAR